MEESPRGAVRPVWLWQLRAGRGGVLSGHSVHAGGEDLLGQVFKLLLGLIFASGTVIVFSDIPADIPAARMVVECYQNGVTAWLGGGALGALLGGNLLLLCGRPAANLVMVVLALCASLYIFDITPAELWQWVCELGGGVHEKGVAVYEQNAARRAERAAARQAEEEAAALEAGEEPEASDDGEERVRFCGPRLAVRRFQLGPQGDERTGGRGGTRTGGRLPRLRGTGPRSCADARRTAGSPGLYASSGGHAPPPRGV